MTSAKYIGYLGGAAVAAGVAAAIAVAAPGAAHAETGDSPSESKATEKPATTSKADKQDSATIDTETVDAGPASTTFDAVDAVTGLKSQFGLAQPAEPDDEPTDAVGEQAQKSDRTPVFTETPVAAEPQDAPEGEPVEVVQPSGDPLDEASETIALPAKSLALATDVGTEQSIDVAAEPEARTAAGPVPWSPNSFRPMRPEPAPTEVPALIRNVEQTVVNVFEPIPFGQPFFGEGFEAGFRVSQFIPFVNAVIPAVNIVGQLPNLVSGDPVLVRDGTQRIVNNLIATLWPVSVLNYGYDEIAELINLEYEAQQLKVWFYGTTWDMLDPLMLLHNSGESGIPLSPSTPASTAPPSAQVVTLALATSALAATTDDPGSSPFRRDDPNPIGMPVSVIAARDSVTRFLPAEFHPVYREAFELVYRGSQMVPFVNTAIPIAEFLPAVIQLLGGDKGGAQITINQLLLTIGPVSVLYYGYDEIADLLNVEDAAFAAKEQLYITLWDSADPAGLLHNVGDSGLLT